ncbi:glycosyltransferase family 2 protein [Rhizobium lusitanum]|uniref:Glycosyltransferase involved in cell wall biosynthesis n=1 Tax=Rhizobium lusitanum TaxID=293958 RepID=A0A7X0IQX2_9HYPH|nr:glycosyltransferase family A protein [Rhizobium lusitanum]MBB6485405.1 glycosyltransferase involved in cell wall biosynthesis [Rhizobium lusitanum]
MFSLVVCTVDRFDQLERLFRSLVGQRYRKFEVVLVDQNVDGRLNELIERFSSQFIIRHIQSAKGLSRARNNGMAIAEGDYVCFPDDDCWYDPDTLTTAEALLIAHPELAIVTGRTLDVEGVTSVSPTGDVQLELTRWNYLRCGNSNGIFVRRAALAEIGGFDENLGVGSESPFQSGEEADFLLRTLAVGKRVRFFPNLIVHHDRVTTDYGPRQVERARKYGRGFGALIRKQAFPFPYVAYRLLRPIIGWLLALVSLKRDAARYKRAWLLGILEGYAAWPRWRSS